MPRDKLGPQPGPPALGIPYHEPDGPLLLDVDGHVGALDPRVGAEVPQPDIRVPAGRARRRAQNAPRSESQLSALSHPQGLHIFHRAPHPAAMRQGSGARDK